MTSILLPWLNGTLLCWQHATQHWPSTSQRWLNSCQSKCNYYPDLTTTNGGDSNRGRCKPWARSSMGKDMDMDTVLRCRLVDARLAAWTCRNRFVTECGH